MNKKEWMHCLIAFSVESLQKNNEIINNIKNQIEEVKKLISENRNHQTIKNFR